MGTFKPPVGIDRMERASKRAALAPGVRRWFRFDKAGHSSMITADKHAIAQQTGVQVPPAADEPEPHKTRQLGRTSGCKWALVSGSVWSQATDSDCTTGPH